MTLNSLWKISLSAVLAFYKQNLHEYEQVTATAVVKGRLREHLLFWVEIGAPPWVLETTRSGYVIPFETSPPGK